MSLLADLFPTFGTTTQTTGAISEDENGSVLDSVWDAATNTFKSFAQLHADIYTAEKLADLRREEEQAANIQTAEYAGNTPETRSPAETNSMMNKTNMMIGFGLVGLALFIALRR